MNRYRKETSMSTHLRPSRRFFFSSRRRHTRSLCDWSSDVCSSDLVNRHVRNIRVTSLHYGDPMGSESFRDTVAVYLRSEERRVGKECRSRLWTDEEKKR